jgi:hypothetical protein
MVLLAYKGAALLKAIHREKRHLNECLSIPNVNSRLRGNGHYRDIHFVVKSWIKQPGPKFREAVSSEA